MKNKRKKAMGNKKECLHTFRSVYYGSEWEVECSKCDENVGDLYSSDDARMIVEGMLNENKKQKNGKQKNNSRNVRSIWL